MKNNSIKIILITVLPTLFLFLPNQTFAHVLKSSGSVGAVLHINPQDDPIAGEESGFFFEFKDKENTFSLAECECTFSVKQSGTVVYSQRLEQAGNDSTNGVASYTFPAKDVYVIEVTGKPKTQDAFDEFTLTYPIRVSRETDVAASDNNDNEFLRYLPLGFLALLFGLFVTHTFLKQRNIKKGGEK